EDLAQEMEKRKEELMTISVQEGGKPWNDTKVEVNRAIEGVKMAAHYMHEMKGEEVVTDLMERGAGRKAFTLKEPIGVVASLSAFNHPINLAVHQIIPAVAVGTPVIFKPAPVTPRSGKRIIELLHGCGLPEAHAQYLLCSNENAERFSSDQRISYMSFIGSYKIGWYLRSRLSEGATCALEHGGAA
ncbi:MAG: aldehyde dehydrogenase family protein, partial [Flavobacteriales bacterium]